MSLFPFSPLLTPFRVALIVSTYGLSCILFGPSDSTETLGQMTKSWGVGTILGTIFMCGLTHIYFRYCRGTPEGFRTPTVFPPVPLIIGLAMVFIKHLPWWPQTDVPTQNALGGFEGAVALSMVLLLVFGKEPKPPKKKRRMKTFSEVGVRLAALLKPATQPAGR